ncbi:MAG: putative small membrane protein [Marinobacter excellens HL-55]|uniref:Putative small membrane protein n=1 Tax=Marinobacter excellens HL-55 TaxID=1305731 RepID=A0A0P7ZKN5_9GAMM|nr:MAG: putative small membrane protein [Marinobacter excellens HL-55]
MAIRWALAVGAFAGLLAVMAGAFGAHGLRQVVSERGLEVFQTAVSYQMYHALILVAASLMPALGLSRRLLVMACGFWLVGIVLFSGSLYLLVLSGARWLGPVTPVGGVCFMIGWALLAAAALKK